MSSSVPLFCFTGAKCRYGAVWNLNPPLTPQEEKLKGWRGKLNCCKISTGNSHAKVQDSSKDHSNQADLTNNNYKTNN